tara:strand:+ start:155 stop:1081 length:927 start_codon:yes stop_codon:yes gene_type:complete
MSMLLVPHPTPVHSTRANMTEMMPPYDPEDEWVDTDDIVSVPKTPHAAQCPSFNFADLKNMPMCITLVNFVKDGNGNTLFRDEPVRKQYPGIRFNSKMASYDSVLVRLVLYYENSEGVAVRVPDIKTKQMSPIRRSDGLVVSPQECGSNTIEFKKKCMNKKSGHDTAFELGVNYQSHTNGIPSQFAFVLVPFQNGRFLVGEAGRSEKFYVKSKRQERFLPHNSRSKRPKKNTEALRVETNIKAAQDIHDTLRQRLRVVQHDNAEYMKLMSSVRTVLTLMPDGPVKIGLSYGSRSLNTENDANTRGVTL